ncbi:MAG: alpha-L-fucosidase [Halobacteriaceae archaeon]
MTDRRDVLRALAGAGGLAGLAGCGGDGDGTATPTPDVGDPASVSPGSETTPQSTTTPRPTTSSVPYEPPDPAPPAPTSMTGFHTAVDDRLAAAESTIAGGPFRPTRDSLRGADPVPEWFRDAKFGIYFHLGPYAVPAFDSEWYPRNMYDPESEVHDHHVETYGAPDEHPYQDFVPEYTAADFDAAGLVDLFADAGARFCGMVAVHADGWANWDSAITPWNAGERGPERDLLSDLAAAVHDSDLRLVASFHNAYTDAHDYYEPAFEHYPSVTEGFPARLLYGDLSDSRFADQWLAGVCEVVERYAPDLTYFDSGLDGMPVGHRRRMLAAVYNAAAARNRRAVVTYKQSDLPSGVAVRDHEEGGVDAIRDRPWLADFPIGSHSWGYVEGQRYKPAGAIVHTLVDAVSKNGQVMLNVSPRADGTLPAAQRDRLRAVGDWLDVHGEAVYGTRPWLVAGEGPGGDGALSARRVRYTQSKDGGTVYAVVMGWPVGSAVTLEAPTVAGPPGLPTDTWATATGSRAAARGGTGPPRVTLLGHGPVGYRVDGEDRLSVEVPYLVGSDRPSKHAIAFALEGFDLEAR